MMRGGAFGSRQEDFGEGRAIEKLVNDLIDKTQ